jgi:tetratricopeptide (TPR) repeat protein
MKLPTTYDDDMLHYNFPLQQSRSNSAVVFSLVYPPVGFFPFYDIGNGDQYGFYWPIGREDKPPLVAFMSHDAISLIPEHSSVESMYECRLACSADNEDAVAELDDYRILLESDKVVSRRRSYRKPERRGSEVIASDDFASLLMIDNSSPFYLCASADLHAANDQFDEAEEKYRSSLMLCPDYAAAHFGLAAILSGSRPIEATTHFRHALLAPPSFYGGSFWKETSLPGSFREDWLRESIAWLQNSAVPNSQLIDDPLLKMVDELQFLCNLAAESDLRVLDEVLNQFVDLELFDDAAKLWQTIGHHASFGLSSFTDVMRLTPRSFGNRLADLFRQAGNRLRSDLVSDMLERMRDPEGHYL